MLTGESARRGRHGARSGQAKGSRCEVKRSGWCRGGRYEQEVAGETAVTREPGVTLALTLGAVRLRLTRGQYVALDGVCGGGWVFVYVCVCEGV